MGFKVLIPQDITSDGKNYLSEKGYEIKMGTGITTEVLVKEVEDCDAILARTALYTAEVIKAGKKLKVIGRYGIGVDNIDIEACTERGIYVCNAPQSNNNSVAEHVLALMLALAKNIVKIDEEFKAGDFEIRNRLASHDLEGKTLGLLGLGRIGTLVAKKAALGFGMKVIGYDAFLPADKVAPEIEFISDINRVYRESDFVSLHIPATKETKGSVGKAQFEMMKPSAYFINCARGEVVNEAELIEALRNKTIAGAGLDVFQQEPPEKDNPLLKMDNVIVSPHYAALTVESTNRMGLHAAIGIDEVLSGKKPTWLVNSPKLV